MKELRTEIEIDAPPERVWAVFTALPDHSRWNPFIRRFEGELRAGARLTVELGTPGDKPMTFRPTVLEVTPNRRLRWLGRLLVPGVFDGEHIFELEPVGSRATHFVQRERFRGLLVPVLASTLDTKTRRGFEAMNHALKEEVET